MSPRTKDKPAPKVKSLHKAIQVLKCFSTSQPELGVTEISQILDLQKSTVHNILSTFEGEGFIEQDPETKRYRLGMHILYLSNIVREGLGLRKVALPVMEKVKEAFGETVHLAIEEDGQVVYLESIQPADRSVNRLAVGKRASIHCTGVGKAILAFAPDERVKAIIDLHGLPRYTQNTITRPQDLLEELRNTRARGYAVDNMEHEWGIRCIAVPIRDESGRIGASMSISGPSERFPLEEIDTMAQSFITYGLEISRRLGWEGY
ncbi:MAG: IclR family transcriptional regulator [Limnochordia bacterium]|jgi:IclR family KDG regulon transcriptional repressor|nr:IclR family transcriptional regulator [Limnochordia bacterium]MDD2628586.1 IclR family transcriptional regulator [Limnochordia bacterium]MDD4517338.1 IclR family transcriptional regulator [Limnochordia bacterium]